MISRRDPGVPNWLDKGDYPWGIIQMRWNRASDYPDPIITKVPFDEIRAHLPEDTPGRDARTASRAASGEAGGGAAPAALVAPEPATQLQSRAAPASRSER